jgi:hypothetical protein
MRTLIAATAICLAIFSFDAFAQKRRGAAATAAKPREIGSTAIVMDESLSVLRMKPSLFSVPIQRMRRGRPVKILGVAEADGVKFYRVTAIPGGAGWVQADAVFGKFREGDDSRLARLVQAMSGFDQVEAANEFFNIYPKSVFRPAILLLYGDVIEDLSVTLSRNATRALDRREMAATGAPLHSYYLNYVSLDRYRRLGVTFLFNPNTKLYHYDGASWKDIIAKYPTLPEAAEAQKRLDSLTIKMEKKVSN